MSLGRRDTEVSELMDDPDCDLAALQRTYAQFAWVNRLVAGWWRVYQRHLVPLLSPTRLTTVLDVGAGAGDVARALAGWAVRDGLRLEVTAIDPDPRAFAYATSGPSSPRVVFRRATSGALVGEGCRFDVVISNHLLHHLDPGQLAALLDDSVRLARRLVLHNDLYRSRPAYLAWAIAARPFARHSFLHVDGLRSIRRSYRPAELAARAGPGWQVRHRFPARVLLTHPGATEAGPRVRIGA